jgi:phosphoglycolate phosphatase-like HAD superfamily hydrolase
LFDIDNTLLWADGAGSRAFDGAFAEHFGVTLEGLADARGDVPMAGRTDTAILRDLVGRHGVAMEGDGFQSNFIDLYVRHLAMTLAEGRGRVLPGVPDLLETLQRRTNLGLATGNWREPAWMKLRHFRLDGYFADGGFGDAGEERATVDAEAIAMFGRRLAD